ncbi:MAG: thioredoxin family protein [bacterium]|nr:thioredoxin family protein [bacterium]
MTRSPVGLLLMTLLLPGWLHAATVDVAATGQLQAATKGPGAPEAKVYRSLDAPVAFLVTGSVFGRPVWVTTAPTSARLLDPARVTPSPSDAETMRVDTGGPQQDFLGVRFSGPDLVLDRDGVALTLTQAPPILGERTGAELLAALPEYRRNAARYEPDAASVAVLRRATQPLELLVFFGSWCSHCEEMVPRLLKVMQEAQGTGLTVRFHGVPADGAPDKVADAMGVRALPTGVLRRDGKEVARMDVDDWEHPDKSLARLVAAR